MQLGHCHILPHADDRKKNKINSCVFNSVAILQVIGRYLQVKNIEGSTH